MKQEKCSVVRWGKFGFHLHPPPPWIGPALGKHLFSTVRGQLKIWKQFYPLIPANSINPIRKMWRIFDPIKRYKKWYTVVYAFANLKLSIRQNKIVILGHPYKYVWLHTCYTFIRTLVVGQLIVSHQDMVIVRLLAQITCLNEKLYYSHCPDWRTVWNIKTRRQYFPVGFKHSFFKSKYDCYDI